MKIVCIGRNYADHAKELGNQVPTEPLFFFKPESAILHKDHPFAIPEWTRDCHYEVELVVRLDRAAKWISPEHAGRCYASVGLGIDFTARDIQAELKAAGKPWEKAKAFDGSAVIGKWASKSNFDTLDNLPFSLHKNNEIVQSSTTQDMLWSIDEIIAYVSKFFTLKIGDIIFTGTPSGVSSVQPDDTLKGFIGEQEFFSIKVK